MSEESLQFVGSAALLFFCILIVHSLWMTARKIPAARNVRPNGVKGGLLLTVIFCFAMVVIDAASAANILIFVNGQSPAGATAADVVRHGTPGIAGSILFMAAIHRFVTGRTRRAFWFGVILMWCAGPLNEWLAVFSQRATELMSAEIVTGCTVLATLYLLVSKRSRNTYVL